MRDLDLSDPRTFADSLVVSASAGSGKTFTLTVLVTATLGCADLRAYEILATTFSEAATADLRERLLRPLDLLSALRIQDWEGLLPLLGTADVAGRKDFLEALPLGERLGRSCMEVAQAAVLWHAPDWADSPVRAQAFWRRTRREAELLQVSTIHGLALGLLRQGAGAPEAILDTDHPALLRLLRQAARETLALPEEHPDHAAARVLLAWAEQNWTALSRGHDGHRDAMGHLEPEDLAPRRQALAEALAAAEQAFAPFAKDPELAKESSSNQVRHFKASMVLPVPGPSATLARRIRWAGSQARVGWDKGYFSAGFKAAFGTLGPVADAWEAWLRALLVEVLRRFEALKTEHAQATFGDLVWTALQGLENGGLEPPRPRLLLVDEYQDTSRAQDAFLAALGAERTVRVGDVKQAIYGFRGGDPALLKGHLLEAGDRAFRLAFNFRSAPALVDLANTFVDELWPRFDAEAGELDGRQVSAAGAAPPVGLARSIAPPLGTNLPDLADWIAVLSNPEGWDQALGPVAGSGPRRRALLLRQRTKLPILLQRLKRRGIQPYVVAREGFWDSPGVRLMMAALEAVAHPDRSLPCAALLRNLCGVVDGEMTALARAKDGRASLPGLGDLDPAFLPEDRAQAVAWLLDLRGATTQEIAGRLLVQGALLRRVNALSAHGVMEPLRARRNLAALLAQLVELPASPAAAFALLDEERSGQERGDLPAPTEGADLLIQTVHGSKGLEYDDVILPLMNGQPRPFKRGEMRTAPEGGALLLGWKLGEVAGQGYLALKPLVESRQRKDDLNLLYVALTRAKQRLCLLLQEPATARAPEESKTWAQFGQHLASTHAEWQPLGAPPQLAPPLPATAPPLDAPPSRTALAVGKDEDDPHAMLAPEARTRARQEGEDMHAFLRDLLVRWPDPGALDARLLAPPDVKHARENALRFLEQFEARGWRHLRRRAELPLSGAAASGATGRADLVVWDQDRIHLLDFKHSKSFQEEELAQYRAQLRRYADVLQDIEGLPVEAWLVALRSGTWVQV